MYGFEAAGVITLLVESSGRHVVVVALRGEECPKIKASLLSGGGGDCGPTAGCVATSKAVLGIPKAVLEMRIGDRLYAIGYITVNGGRRQELRESVFTLR